MKKKSKKISLKCQIIFVFLTKMALVRRRSASEKNDEEHFVPLETKLKYNEY